MPDILIVDDSNTHLLMVATILEKDSYDVCVARDGKEALKIVEYMLFDLIITDLDMPGMDGIPLIVELSKRKLTESVPIIILSIEPERDLSDVIHRVGISCWIQKPVNSDILLEKVHEVLD